MYLPRELIDELFMHFIEAKKPGLLMESIYALVIPNWDKVKAVRGHPRCGVELWKHIGRRWIDHDIIYNRQQPLAERITPGGAWIQNGFSADDTLFEWEATIVDCPIIYDYEGGIDGFEPAYRPMFVESPEERQRDCDRPLEEDEEGVRVARSPKRYNPYD